MCVTESECLADNDVRSHHTDKISSRRFSFLIELSSEHLTSGREIADLRYFVSRDWT